MRKARVFNDSEYHYFKKNDIVEFERKIGDFFLFRKGLMGQLLFEYEFEWLDDPDEFIVATIGGKQYKCFPMEDGE